MKNAGANRAFDPPVFFTTSFQKSQEIISFAKENCVDMHRYGWNLFSCMPEEICRE
jgi:hypothetical protein